MPNVAIVGATGLVGTLIARVLEERAFPVDSIKFLASSRSGGKSIRFCGTSHSVEPLRPEAFAGIDYVLSSTPASISREFSPDCRESWRDRNRQLVGLADGSRGAAGGPGSQFERA